MCTDELSVQAWCALIKSIRIYKAWKIANDIKAKVNRPNDGSICLLTSIGIFFRWQHRIRKFYPATSYLCNKCFISSNYWLQNSIVVSIWMPPVMMVVVCSWDNISAVGRHYSPFVRSLNTPTVKMRSRVGWFFNFQIFRCSKNVVRDNIMFRNLTFRAPDCRLAAHLICLSSVINITVGDRGE